LCGLKTREAKTMKVIGVTPNHLDSAPNHAIAIRIENPNVGHNARRETPESHLESIRVRSGLQFVEEMSMFRIGDRFGLDMI
jgi:hypothetical protein